jgi:predicted DCC family thiol-disulfide oxidoreductase YuxK
LDKQGIPITFLEASAATLIYDGDCGFCNASLNWAYRNLETMPAALPYKLALLSDYGLSKEEAENAVYLVSAESKLRGHNAISQLFLFQKGKYKLLGRLMSWRLLSPIMKLGYYLVAKNRRFLPGATDTCGIRPGHSK